LQFTGFHPNVGQTFVAFGKTFVAFGKSLRKANAQLSINSFRKLLQFIENHEIFTFLWCINAVRIFAYYIEIPFASIYTYRMQNPYM